MERKIGFAFDNYMMLHENFKRNHPERPARLMAIYTHLEKIKLLDSLRMIQFDKVDMKYVEMVHDKSLLKQVEQSDLNSKELRIGKKVLKEPRETHYIDNDVYVNKYSKDCAYLAAGASIASCEAVF